jgi:hypothetical protein
VLRYTLAELLYQLTAAAKTRGRTVLHAHPSVIGALTGTVPAADPVPPGMPDPSRLTAVELTAEPSWVAGSFRLIRHDGCYVNAAGDVHHGACPVTADGIVDLLPPARCPD